MWQRPPDAFRISQGQKLPLVGCTAQNRREESYSTVTEQRASSFQPQLHRSLWPSPSRDSRLPFGLSLPTWGIQALPFLSGGSKISIADIFLNAKWRTCYCWTRGCVKSQQPRRKTIPRILHLHYCFHCLIKLCFGVGRNIKPSML